MPGILITNVNYQGQIGDIVVHEMGTVTALGNYEQTIDGNGLIAVPAFEDQHVHFRDPGQLEKEDLLSGARAAAAGGFLDVDCEPNTKPVIDSLRALDAFDARVEKLEIPIGISPKCALTIGQQGQQLVDIESIVGQRPWTTISSDGEPVVDRRLLVRAFQQAGDGTRIDLHCEETPRSAERLAAVLGNGTPMAREPELIKLAIGALAEAGAGQLHIQHVSMAASLQLLDWAKRDGLPVTAEVTPHHLLLCEDDIPQRNGAPDANWKMNPPLRSRADMMAMRKGLEAGLIDLIATDHAPHTVEEKARPWDEAPFGVIGLETAFGAVMSLVHAGELSFSRVIDAMTGGDSNELYGVNLIDPNFEWVIDPKTFYSKSRNTPFTGMLCKGKVIYAIRDGRLLMADGEVLF